MNTYSIGHAARILKVSPSRLRYWERTELLQSSLARSFEDGPDPVGELQFRDLVCVRGILSLLERGVSLQRIRRNVEMLRERMPEIDDPLAALRLWSEGSGKMVVRHGGVLQEPGGQILLDFGIAEHDLEPTHLDEGEEGKPGTAAQDEAVELFEQGCGVDGDPATYRQAIKLYRRALELHESFADCHCNLGAVLYNHGDRASATRHFRRCLDIEANHIEGHFNLANLLEEDGATEIALRHYRLALASDPLYPDLHINLALLLEKLDRADEARVHWRRYLQLDPDGAWTELARQRLDGVD